MTQALTNGAWATTLVEGLLSGGCRDAVLSPGSRHTPIVLALHHAAQAGRVRLHTILDERTAGFFALGVARVTGAPTLLACTSGTAGSHYLPALIEASHDRLPVIALTADRHVNWAPFFHPSGDWLVYATSRVSHRNYEVFALPLTGDLSIRKQPVRITNASGFDGLPVFSPEGSMMMWTAQRGQDRNDEGRPSSQLWLAKTTGQKIPDSASTESSAQIQPVE